jgi:hypothetical protein
LVVRKIGHQRVRTRGELEALKAIEGLAAKLAAQDRGADGRSTPWQPVAVRKKRHEGTAHTDKVARLLARDKPLKG